MKIPKPDLIPLVPRLLALAVCPLWLAGRASGEAIFQSLHSFGQQGPTAPLIKASDGNLYGTVPAGGPAGFSTVFRITTNGDFTPIYSLSNANDGISPQGALTQASDANLYGTTQRGGASGNGTVFRVTTNGGFTTL